MSSRRSCKRRTTFLELGIKCRNQPKSKNAPAERTTVEFLIVLVDDKNLQAERPCAYHLGFKALCTVASECLLVQVHENCAWGGQRWTEDTWGVTFGEWTPWARQ